MYEMDEKMGEWYRYRLCRCVINVNTVSRGRCLELSRIRSVQKRKKKERERERMAQER
jgi:hypothetical protein